MKVIFLDFDGVLNSEYHLHRCHQLELDTEDDYGTVFDPMCVDNLRQIVEQTGACVVLITSWKRLGEEPMHQLWEGRNMPGRLLGITPNDVPAPAAQCDDDGMLPEGFSLFSLASKGREIEEWMRRNGEPESYVIIDDWPDFTPDQQSHYLRTDPYAGLTTKDVERAVSLLGHQNSPTLQH